MYWKNFLHQVLAVVKQLKAPTFFLTLSCADFRQNELISIIYKLNGVDIVDEKIDRISYHEWCDTLNKNSVLAARHFQYRVETFLKVSFGKTQYYAIRVYSQVRGRPHIYSFILKSLKLTKHSLYEYTELVYGIVRADLPDAINEPALFELVKTYPMHHHSKTFRKHINEKCRTYFDKFYGTTVRISHFSRYENMQRRNAILKQVKYYTDDELNPSKEFFFENSKDDYVELK